jgi:hypothetical protein
VHLGSLSSAAALEIGGSTRPLVEQNEVHPLIIEDQTMP